MRHYIIATALLAAFWGGWAASNAKHNAAALRVELAQVQADLEQANETARVLRAHSVFVEKQRAELAALAAELQNIGGHDAPLSDLLRRAAGGLWP